ncbi:MAG: TetR/AcrR family transcriptional regulator [Acidimicrobiales bacterium]
MVRDKGTRERILDVALELFNKEGYDRASLREIAERLGITKAALYYHFPSKADILFALHLRMHALIDEPLQLLGDGPVSLERWEDFLAAAVEKLEGNTALFLLHRNNQAAFASLHLEGHSHAHTELEEWAHKVFNDPSLSPDERLKLAASFAVAFVTPMMAVTLLGPDAREHLGPTLRYIVHAVLHAPEGSPGDKPKGRSLGPGPAGEGRTVVQH